MSPAGKARATNAQRQVVCAMVDIILNQMRVDFLALGETTEQDVKEIEQTCKLTEFDVERGFAKAGRSHFDTCFLYRSNKLSLTGSQAITAAKGNRMLKIAQKATFEILGHGKPLHVFISHWPSRLWCHENSSDRNLLGIRLRDAVEDVIAESGKLANVILLGDYNDEPFDASLEKQLMATRDRVLAKERPHLLYNPFWQHLSLPKSHSTYGTDDDNGGTYFHSIGEITRWRTFDQIIFSFAFLGNSEWHLNEQLTGILDVEGYKAMVINANEIFDHFPVLGVIEKVESHG